jgi:hypothetical protein
VAAAVGLLAVVLGGCGDDQKDNIALMARAEWRRDPGSAAEVGYEVWADVGWIDRIGTCARISKALRVTVNDIEAPLTEEGGECPFDALFIGGAFTRPDPVTVRLFDGDHLLGAATFDGAFWGAQARLIAPAAGQVQPGDPVVVSIPPDGPPPTLTYARWYWLDTAPSVPPFYTGSDAPVGDENTTISAHVPDVAGLSGRVVLAFTYGPEAIIGATTCTGFSSCAMTVSYALGPISLDVLAP